MSGHYKVVPAIRRAASGSLDEPKPEARQRSGSDGPQGLRKPLVEWKVGTQLFTTLQWRHNEHNGASNHQPSDCLLNCLFRSKKTSKLLVTGVCAGNSPVTGEFPTQMASNAENVSIWWRHHELLSWASHTTHMVSLNLVKIESSDGVIKLGQHWFM